MAYTSSSSAAVTLTAPARSKRRAQAVSTLSSSSRGVNSSTTSPTGMLMKKTHSQPSEEVTGPRPGRRAPRSAPRATRRLGAARREPKLICNRRQGDVDDRPVEDHHEEGGAEQRQRQPAARGQARWLPDSFRQDALEVVVRTRTLDSSFLEPPVRQHGRLAVDVLVGQKNRLVVLARAAEATQTGGRDFVRSGFVSSLIRSLLPRSGSFLRCRCRTGG